MKATDLLRKSQTDFTNSETLGVTEPIKYFHKKTKWEETVFAFVNENIHNDPDKKTRVTEGVFSSVMLENQPRENDEITYNDNRYTVKVWTQSQGKYIITTERKRHHTAKRVTVG